jgi:hypothetical protein
MFFFPETNIVKSSNMLYSKGKYRW